MWPSRSRCTRTVGGLDYIPEPGTLWYDTGLKGARDRKRREMAGIGERGIKAMVKKQSSERSVFYGLAGLSSLSLVR